MGVRRMALVSGCSALALGLLFSVGDRVSRFASANDDAAGRAASAQNATMESAEALPPAPTTPHFVTGLETLPKSLRDIEVDGQLRADANGNLILDADIRRVFDFFLNAVGEESSAQIIARLQAYIRAHLPASAARQALQILQEYLALRDAMSDAQRDASGRFAADHHSLSADTLRDRKQAIRALRSHHLSAEVDQAFYGEEDQFDDFTLAKLALIEDTSLSAAQRSEHIAMLEAGLPPALQAHIAAASRYQTLSQLTGEWTSQQADAAHLRQIRENIVNDAQPGGRESMTGWRSGTACSPTMRWRRPTSSKKSNVCASSISPPPSRSACRCWSICTIRTQTDSWLQTAAHPGLP
jgi:lipase chaperone LimK